MPNRSTSPSVYTISDGEFTRKSTIISYGSDLPDVHYNLYREKKICGVSGVVFITSTAIIITFLIILGLLALVIFVILHHTL